MSGDHPGEPERDADAAVPSAPHPYSYVTIRLTAAEFEQVARAARAAGQTLPEYGREAILAQAFAALELIGIRARERE